MQTATNRRAARRALSTAILAPVVLAAAACSSGAEAPSTEARAASAVTEYSVHPGTAEDEYVGALVDVTDLECEPATDGAWVARGLVTNPTEADAAYRIYVAFLDADADTRGLVQADVSAGAGEEAQPWEAEIDLSGEEDLRCVLRVERSGEGVASPDEMRASDPGDAEETESDGR